MNDTEKIDTRHTLSRLLHIYEVVVRSGPIALDDIYPLAQRSRSATFRALKNLEASGWIRRTMNGRQYIATAVIDNLSGTGAISLPELDLLCSLLSDYRKQNRLWIQIGFYVTNQSFVLLECSESKDIPNLTLCPGGDNIACAAFSLLTDTGQQRIAQDLDTRLDLVSRNQFWDQVKNYRTSFMDRGYIYDHFLQTIYIGITTPTGLTGSMSVTKKVLRLDETDIKKHAAVICGLLQQNNLLEQLACQRFRPSRCSSGNRWLMGGAHVKGDPGFYP